jgi:hypothetical protein
MPPGLLARVSQIARAEVFRAWLEAAARCECPSLDDCPLF